MPQEFLFRPDAVHTNQYLFDLILPSQKVY